jgi:hypothetical protein
MKAKALADDLADLGDARDMFAGIAIAIFDGAGEAPDDFFFAGEKVYRGLFDFPGQAIGVVGQLDLSATQGQEIGDARLEFDWIEGFCQEIIGADADGLDANGLVDVRGDHDHGHGAIIFAGTQGLDKGDAVHLGHDVVNEQQVILTLLAPLERLARVEAQVYAIAHYFPDDRAKQSQTRPAVVYDQHIHNVAPRHNCRGDDMGEPLCET